MKDGRIKQPYVLFSLLLSHLCFTLIPSINFSSLLFCYTFFFLLQNALALSRNIEPVTLEQAHAQRMRNYVLSKLTSAAVKPPKQRKVCDMVGCTQPKLPTDWVCCEVCGRWCHYKCVQICKPPEGDYVCSICKAQYE